MAIVRGMSKKRYELIVGHLHELEVDIENGIIRNRKEYKPTTLGYRQINLGGTTVLVHQILAVARWGEGCVGMTVKFKNDVKKDLREKNLQLVFHATGTKLRGCQAKPKAKIKATNIKTGKTQEFESQREASRVLSIQQSAISFVINGFYKQTNGYVFERVVA